MLRPTRPQSLRIQEIGLRTPSKSISQARLLIAVGTIQGKSSPARKKRLKWNRSLSKSARPSPRSSLKGTVPNAVDEGVLDRLPEDRIVEVPAEIIEADEVVVRERRRVCSSARARCRGRRDRP